MLLDARSECEPKNSLFGLEARRRKEEFVFLSQPWLAGRHPTRRGKAGPCPFVVSQPIEEPKSTPQIGASFVLAADILPHTSITKYHPQ